MPRQRCSGQAPTRWAIACSTGAQPCLRAPVVAAGRPAGATLTRPPGWVGGSRLGSRVSVSRRSVGATGRLPTACSARDAVAASSTRLLTTYSPSTLGSRGCGPRRPRPGVAAAPGRCRQLQRGPGQPGRQQAAQQQPGAEHDLERAHQRHRQPGIHHRGDRGDQRRRQGWLAGQLEGPNHTKVMPSEPRSGRGTARPSSSGCATGGVTCL
jgi:hypothetical protein